MNIATILLIILGLLQPPPPSLALYIQEGDTFGPGDPITLTVIAESEGGLITSMTLDAPFVQWDSVSPTPTLPATNIYRIMSGHVTRTLPGPIILSLSATDSLGQQSVITKTITLRAWTIYLPVVKGRNP